MKFTNGNSHDVVTGNNGLCNGTIMCKATKGYDGSIGPRHTQRNRRVLSQTVLFTPMTVLITLS